MPDTAREHAEYFIMRCSFHLEAFLHYIAVKAKNP